MLNHIKRTLHNFPHVSFDYLKKLLVFSLFAYIPLQAAEKEHVKPEGFENQFDRLTLVDKEAPHTPQKAPSLETDIVAQESPFDWQNRQHYQEIKTIFSGLAEREFVSIIERTIKEIQKSHGYFDDRYDSMLFSLRNTIYGWMNETIFPSWSDVCSRNDSRDNHSNYSDDSDDDEDGWRKAYKRGFEQSEEDEELSEYGSDTSSVASSNDDENYEQWKCAKLSELLDIDVNHSDEFSRESIDINAVRLFLERHCERGYSWLLNQVIEGDLLTSEDFAEDHYESLNVPKEILHNIFGGLWFDYDWEELDVSDSQFIAQTYIATLRKLQAGSTLEGVKESLLSSLEQLFTFNASDFNAPFNNVKTRYDQYVKNNNWLGALVEWSVYSTYRKVFATPAKKSKIKLYTQKTPALSLFNDFNKEKYLTNRLQEAYKRAREMYSKVYPHINTQKIVYSTTRAQRAELAIAKPLGYLKSVGKILEKKRKRNAENVFIPQLYFVVSAKPNQTMDNETIRFLEVPLELDNYPRRPLTRSDADGVFTHMSNADYFDIAEKDVVSGKVIQGKDKAKATEDITCLRCNAGLCNPNLVHSERGVAHVLRQKENVKKLCKTFTDRLFSSSGNGAYTVYGAVMLGYSTNTVCPNCTPTLISLQNSHENGGFLYLLNQELNALQGRVTFRTKGYDQKSNQMDWSQFKLNTVVTASIDFDGEGRDLADQGQHSYGGNTNPPQNTHNPHAKLFFPNDEIDISKATFLGENTLDSCQRFFYEFVGKEIHTQPQQDNPYLNDKGKVTFKGVVFSSGSTSWGHGVMA